MARRSRGLSDGSLPERRAATVISRMRRVKILPRLASVAAFLCLMFAHLLWPARTERMRDAELVEHPGDDEVNELRDRLWPVVEARRRRKDHCARACKLQHVFEMDRGERCLARHQHERTALLQHDVGRARDQVVREATDNGGQRAHAAGTYRHRVGGVRSRRDGRHPVLAAEHCELTLARAVAFGEKACRLARLRREHEIAFLLRDDLCGRRVEEENASLFRQQAFEQPETVGEAGRAGPCESDRLWRGHPRILRHAGQPSSR